MSWMELRSALWLGVERAECLGDKGGEREIPSGWEGNRARLAGHQRVRHKPDVMTWMTRTQRGASEKP